MTETDRRRRVRVAVVTGDSGSLVAELANHPWPPDMLQQIGDGLVHALRHGVDAAREAASDCARQLREREWSGDEELVAVLEGLLGSGPTPMLRWLAVDLEELASVLEGDPVYGGGRMNRATGEVWPTGLDDDFWDEDDDDEEDTTQWIYVHCEGSRDGYRDMQRFVDRVDDERVASALERSLDGRGAFRRFRDALSRWPELSYAYAAYSDERKRGRAREWLAGEGYAAELRVRSASPPTVDP